MKKYNLDLFEKIPLLKNIAKWRWFPFLAILLNLLLFYIFLMAGIWGTPVGNRNILVMFVWILWWFLLITLMVPFASRIWCAVCPFPFFGEWLQRFALIKVKSGKTLQGWGLKWAWPKGLRNIWLQNFGFLSIAVFSVLLVTRPFVSAVVLGGIVVLATVLGFVFQKRTFCMYLCPVSGFLSLYALPSKLGLRAKDVTVCNRIKAGEEFSFDEGIASCRLACPAGVDASSYIALIAKGEYERALEVVREVMPFVGVCGRVCTHPCEDKCLRAELDEAVSICRLKRFLADHGSGQPIKEFRPIHGEKIAVIGTGPAGLTCAYHLARKGYEVTAYESLPVAGGMLRVGIPDYKLPKSIVDQEIEFIKNTGVKIVTNTVIGKDITFDELQKKYQAIFIAVGASESRRLKIEGENLVGVYNAIELLRKINLGEKIDLGRKVVVIGGGDTAIDVARSAIRLGAAEINIVYRRTKAEMPAIAKEVSAAEEEGIKIQFLTSPVKVVGSNGKANALLCVKMTLGELDATGRPRPVPLEGSEHLISADAIIVATGQYSDISFLPSELSTSDAGTIIVDPETMITNLPGIFAGGDVVRGPDVLIYAIEVGRKAALAIDRYLRGEELKPILLHPSTNETRDLPLGTIHREERTQPALLPLERRKEGFAEIEAVFTEEMAQQEAARCLKCGICGECYRGNENGYGCPWFERMGSMERNNYCGLCMECVKTCPKDNIGLYWRKFGSDVKLKGLDESWKAFIMLALALAYSVTLLGPWGTLKNWGNVAETGDWRGFLILAAAYLSLSLGVVPFFHLITAALSRWLAKASHIPIKDYFVKYSYVFVPFGLMAWIAFSIPLIMVNGSYIISVISDPFGWGWNLFETANFPWTPFFPEWVPYLQIVVLLLGLFTSIEGGYRVGKLLFTDKKRIIRALIPFVVLLTLITMVFLRLFVG